MLFIIKKWIGGLLMPLPFALCILFISLILLFFTQKQKLAKTMALFSFLILLIFSVLPTAYYLSKPLERKYPPLVSGRAIFRLYFSFRFSRVYTIKPYQSQGNYQPLH